MEQNPIGWVEIPVTDMDRAKAFYETVFRLEIEVHPFGDLVMGWLPYAQGKEGASGSLVLHREAYKTSETHGPVIYFSRVDVQQELERVEAAGGHILQPKTRISEDIGFMALFRDSEGNRIALHSRV
ncbi:VOC family protein [Robiginitalea marina]|uniref:VOC family protein n=1 Tax=Robiginitalea marina TaxID=2954105 RepID=A0ABT1B124_9FLAO|nr:VOC family protein [Robiginitalea marina]MCO5725989.1 VOC family protein [Robiginitalea marina]